jgi:hypothetical protein
MNEEECLQKEIVKKARNASRNKCIKRRHIFRRKSSNKSGNVNNGDMQ